jgi:hypothetical protein
MRTNTLFILATLLFEGGAVAWAAWEFWSVRPKKKIDAQDRAASPSGSEKDPRHLER